MSDRVLVAGVLILAILAGVVLGKPARDRDLAIREACEAAGGKLVRDRERKVLCIREDAIIKMGPAKR